MKISIQKEDIQISSNQIKSKIAIQKVLIESSINPGVDKNFPNALTSIGTDIRTDLNISWIALQQLCKQPNYSQNVIDLQVPQYCNKAINQCLLIMNWFVPVKFAQIFSQRQIIKHKLYEYVVTYEGIIYRIIINSNVVIKDDKILFAEVVGNSLFPALFQKANAKIYGSYEAISDNLIDLLQLWTGYAPQSFSTTKHTSEQFLQFFIDCLRINNLVLFRTRNSVRLQSAGISSNNIFLVVRVVKIGQQNLIQFLEMNGQRWKGRHSKSSVFWQGKNKEINQQRIVLSEGRENYIHIDDLLGISRQIIFLHNTQKFHKNWIISTPKIKHVFNLIHKASTLTHLMISLHFSKKNCRSSVYIICQQNCSLISGSFKDNRNKNFIAAFLQPNKNYLLYVLNEDIQSKPVGVNISVYSSKAWCEITETSKNIHIQERSFLSLTQDIPSVITQIDPTNKKNTIRIKNLFKQFGLGFVTVCLEPQYNKQVTIKIDQQKLLQLGMEILNYQQNIVRHTGPCHAILIFKFKSKYKEGDCFPPVQTLKISINNQNNNNKSLSHSQF